MNERIDWSAIFIFAVAILGMIGTYWWRYYTDERSKIEIPVEEIKTPLPEKLPTWDAETNHDKG
jgi:hypothetical protein